MNKAVPSTEYRVKSKNQSLGTRYSSLFTGVIYGSN